MEYLPGEKIMPEEYDRYVSRCGDRITRAGARWFMPVSYAVYLDRLEVTDTGVYLNGKELALGEVERYQVRLKARLARMRVHGITPDTDSAASTIADGIEKIEKILAR